LLPLALGGCAVQVHHPTRSAEEQRRDIEICKQHGVLVEPMEPIAARNVAYKCLEKKGYIIGKRKG
jgi:hypothetical protein